MIRANTSNSRHAFTLIELLVVISLITILLAVAVPAFSGLLDSNERALADSKLKIAASLGRDAAVRAGRGSDGAVAFFQEPGGRIKAIPYVQVGVLDDEDDDGNIVERDVFVKVASFESIELPRSWSVRGFATPNTIDEQWYELTTPTSLRTEGNWVFPESHLFDPKSPTDGEDRQTFFLRFDAGDGTASVPKGRDALLLDPSTSRTLRDDAPFSEFNIDRAVNHESYVRAVLELPTGDVRRRQLLGDPSPDTVLARQVTQLALYDERRLAAALRLRPDRTTNSIYKLGIDPELVGAVSGGGRDIANWIEGRNVASDPAGNPPEKAARIYFVERYSGSLKEMFP